MLPFYLFMLQIEYTEELVEGKLVPTVDHDPFTLALKKPYHPGRVVGAGGSLQGWEKVMGPEYSKSAKSRASVNSPVNSNMLLDATQVSAMLEKVRNEMREEFNEWARNNNMATLPFSEVSSCNQPRVQAEHEIHADEEVHDQVVSHDFPVLQVNLC